MRQYELPYPALAASMAYEGARAQGAPLVEAFALAALAALGRAPLPGDERLVNAALTAAPLAHAAAVRDGADREGALCAQWLAFAATLGGE